MAHDQVRDRLAAFLAIVFPGQVRAHLGERDVEPVPRRIAADARHPNLGPRHQQRRGDREGGRARVARHRDRLSPQFGLAGQGDDAALVRDLGADSGAEAREHPLGMVARRLGLDHHGLRGRVQPGQQHRRLDLRAGDGRCIAHRHGVRRAPDRDRQQPALTRRDLGPEQPQGIGDPPHRPPRQAGVAGERRNDRRRRHRPHDEPHPGPGIAAVDHARRLGEAADAHPVNRPCALAQPLDLGPERLHRARGVQHVLPFQKPGDPRLAHRQRAEDQRPVAHRLVAGHPRLPPQRSGAAGGQRRGFGIVRHGGSSCSGATLARAARPCHVLSRNIPAGGAGITAGTSRSGARGPRAAPSARSAWNASPPTPQVLQPPA